MIVRILGEGQFDVDEEALERLNRLDAEVERALEAEDADAFRAALGALLDGVRAAGVEHPADSLDESDLILPPADAEPDEVRALMDDEGLIPG